MSGGRRRSTPARRSRSEAQPPLWGWHRLSDDAATKVVEAAGIRPGDLVVDVGAGEGALTRPLVRAGAIVIAVELHPGRLDMLRRQFADQAVTVVNADLLSFRWPRQPFRVVANPPYAVWATLLRQLLSRSSRMLSADVVLQRRVVRRLVDRDGAAAERGRSRYQLSRGPTVPRTAFRPAPRVDSAVLVIRRRPPDPGSRNL